MDLMTRLGTIAPFISVVSMVFTGIYKYIKNNPESKLKIFGQSIITSVATYVAVNAIALLIYLGVNLYFYNYTDLAELIAILLTSITLIIVLPLYLVKDEYKTRNAFVITRDYIRFNKDKEHFTEYSKAISENVADDFIDNNFNNVSEEALDCINHEKEQMHKLNKVTTRFNILSLISWFTLPLLALNVFILVFDRYDNKLDFAIVATIISIVMIGFNTFIVYSDTKLQHGVVDHTTSMVKKHDKKYRKILAKQKDKSNKDNEENK
ncbi:hypothetical protein J3T79_13580 [Staphylococcus nepalensis]|uniref:hypothetical protein n=1 Tax=Staphylococcus nepalensis TaxID=214473 RepID=UPI001A97DB15|nr:hypothetical protein [Staphylococcus nepalensis]MBO1217461.1 hypothetical protein [Staphylococcus nepalensis]